MAETCRAARLRVLIIAETYPPKMGYLVTSLSKYLARLGMEVHVVAMDLPPYYNAAADVSGATRFLQEQALAAGSSSIVDGYTVPHSPPPPGCSVTRQWSGCGANCGSCGPTWSTRS